MRTSSFALALALSLGACGKDEELAKHNARIEAANKARADEASALIATVESVRSHLATVEKVSLNGAPKKCATAKPGAKALVVDRELLTFLVKGTPAYNMDEGAGHVESIDDYRSISSLAAGMLRKYDWQIALDKKYEKSTDGSPTEDQVKAARDMAPIVKRGLGDLVIVIDATTKERPQIGNPIFTEGKVAGRAVAIDPVAGKALCQVEFTATNSDSVRSRVASDADQVSALLHDLGSNARRAVGDTFAKAGLEVERID